MKNLESLLCFWPVSKYFVIDGLVSHVTKSLFSLVVVGQVNCMLIHNCSFLRHQVIWVLSNQSLPTPQLNHSFEDSETLHVKLTQDSLRKELTFLFSSDSYFNHFKSFAVNSSLTSSVTICRKINVRKKRPGLQISRCCWACPWKRFSKLSCGWDATDTTGSMHGDHSSLWDALAK